MPLRVLNALVLLARGQVQSDDARVLTPSQSHGCLSAYSHTIPEMSYEGGSGGGGDPFSDLRGRIETADSWSPEQRANVEALMQQEREQRHARHVRWRRKLVSILHLGRS